MLNLHTHSEYSKQDAISRVKEIAQAHKDMGENYFCITDHGTVGSYPEAFKVAEELGIKFLPGCEFYLKPKGMNDLKENLAAQKDPLRILRLKTASKEEKEEAQNTLDELKTYDPQKYYHLTVIAVTGEGLKNLYRVYSDSDYYYKDRIKLSTLKEHKEGLVVLSGCLAGELPHYVKNKRFDEAEQYLKEMKEAFGDNFYVEIQYHGIEQDTRDLDRGYLSEVDTYNKIIELANKYNVKLVATNDSHYTKESDKELHNLYKNICYFKSEAAKDQENSFAGNGYHIVDEEELRDRFRYAGYDNKAIDESFANIKDIESKIEPDGLFMEKGEPLKERKELLREMVMKGWEKKRKGTPLAEASLKQLNYELEIMEEKNFTSYFTNMTTIINRARECGIMTGVGRGSAAGSEVVYLLGITKCDPMQYGLIFERFLNPSRHNYPDIDTDFATKGDWGDELGTTYLMDHLDDTFKFRGRIGNIVTGSSIVLFKKLASYRGVLFSEANKFTTSDIGKEFLEAESKGAETEFIDILNALGLNYTEEWQETYNDLDICYKLRDIVFGSSIHASGVIMTENEAVLPTDYQNVIAFNGVSLEDYGYIKYDFLSLDTLNPIQKILGIDYDWEKCDDPEVWKMIQSGDLDFIFQLAGGVPKAMCVEGKANSIEDLGIITAINRPGPLNMNLNKHWVDIRNGVYEWSEQDRIIADILKKAFGEEHSGLIIYQEDVMRLCTDGAGFTLSEADTVRKAMGKKKPELLIPFEAKFIEGWNKTVGKGNAKEIWDHLVEFSKYGFNKAHAIAYSIISYATAVLWTHHKDEFLEYLINEGTAKQKDKALKKLKEMGYKFEYPGIGSEEVSDKYIVKNRTVYIPNENSYNYKSFSEFIMSDLSALEKNKLVLRGGLDKLTIDRKGLIDLIKSIPSQYFGKEYKPCNDLIDFLDMGSEMQIWSYTEEHDKYHIMFPLSPRARKQKECDIYKNRYIPNDRLEFNIKHDLKNFGSSKANQLSLLPEFDKDILLGKVLKTRENLIDYNGGDIEKIKEDRFLSQAIKRQLENTYYDNQKDPRIANSLNWADEEFKALFMSMSVNKREVNYGNGSPKVYRTAKVTLGFENEANAVFWIRDEKVIDKFQPLMKKSVCKLKLKPDMYINKDFLPVLQIRIVDVVADVPEKVEEKHEEIKQTPVISKSTEINEQEELKKKISIARAIGEDAEADELQKVYDAKYGVRD